MRYQFINFFKRTGFALAAAVLVASGLNFVEVMHTSALSVSSNNDCDDNAVVFCGADSTQALITKYNNGDGHNSAKSIHDIYGFFGISSAEIQALNTTAVAGHVTKDGHVFVDSSSTAVASSALTGGRQTMPGSTAATANGTSFFTRTPNSSFVGDSHPAYVVMKDGVFQFAILASCGNAVKATPTPKPTPPPKPTPTSPAYSVTKEVAVKGDDNFSNNVQVSQGTHVVYRVTVKSTGTGPVTNLTVSDTLPVGIVFTSGSFSKNGTAADDTAANQFFGGGLSAGSLSPGDSDVFMFEATVGSGDSSTQCKSQTLNNVAHTTATSLQPGTATASVNEQCVSAPQCTNLMVDKGDHTVTVTSVNTVLNGATFQSAIIDWGDNTATTAITDVNQVNGQTHTYSGNGPFTITAKLTFSQNGSTVNAPTDSCQAVVSFTTPTVTTAASSTPTSLVNTGPGSTLALAAGVATLGVFGYRYWAIRRLNQSTDL